MISIAQHRKCIGVLKRRFALLKLMFDPKSMGNIIIRCRSSERFHL